MSCWLTTCLDLLMDLHLTFRYQLIITYKELKKKRKKKLKEEETRENKRRERKNHTLTFFKDKLFERLKPHTKKDLYFVGMEPLPDTADSSQGIHFYLFFLIYFILFSFISSLLFLLSHFPPTFPLGFLI